MKFESGQKVICINDHYESYSRYPVKKGTVYTIYSNYVCPCGSRQVTLNEYPGRTLMGCRCHRTSRRRSSYYSWRFMPLDLLHNMLEMSSEKTEVVEKT
jgi:hypothetical protein